MSEAVHLFRKTMDFFTDEHAPPEVGLVALAMGLGICAAAAGLLSDDLEHLIELARRSYGQALPVDEGDA